MSSPRVPRREARHLLPFASMLLRVDLVPGERGHQGAAPLDAGGEPPACGPAEATPAARPEPRPAATADAPIPSCDVQAAASSHGDERSHGDGAMQGVGAMQGNVWDISGSGACLCFSEAPATPLQGKTFNLRLHQATTGAVISSRCRVIWTHTMHGAVFVGVELHDPIDLRAPFFRELIQPGVLDHAAGA